MKDKKEMKRQNWRPGNMLYPVPAVMVACQRPGERPNIITIAWAGTVCSSPAMVSISIRKERHSYDIIKETGEFTINLVTADLTEATDYCGVRTGRQVDKFKEKGLTPYPSTQIAAPGIAECPVIIECRLQQIIALGSHDMFVAEVVNVSVDERHMNEAGKLELNKLGLVAYSHGEYFALGEKIGKFGYSVQKKTSAKQPVVRQESVKNATWQATPGRKKEIKPKKPKKYPYKQHKNK